MDTEEIFEDIAAMSSQLYMARHQDFALLIRRLFKTLETAPEPIAKRVFWLRSLSSFEEVKSQFLKPQSGMGSGRIEWPDEREHRLGAQLALLSEFATGKIEAWNFAHDYFDASSRNVDQILNAMTQGLIQAMLDELSRYLRRNLDSPIPETGALTVPASDRIVGLDHNSAGYSATVAALEALDVAVLASNSIGDAEKERIGAELGASQRLLKSRTVRIAAIGAVLVPALTWLLDITAGTAVGLAVEALIDQLKLLLPMLFG